jgi:ABC-type phosphate transport system auxiliary subunit
MNETERSELQTKRTRQLGSIAFRARKRLHGLNDPMEEPYLMVLAYAEGRTPEEVIAVIEKEYQPNEVEMAKIKLCLEDLLYHGKLSRRDDGTLDIEWDWG